MILKQKDSLDSVIQDLNHALAQPQSALERRALERRLAITQAGLKGEQEAAYHIDFHLKDSIYWAVLHDLRIECNGRVAQIDHLLIGRCLETYVVESKSFRKKIRFANGGWERLNFDHWEGIPSPVEQNRRHIIVLEELIRDLSLAPVRLGMALRPTFFNYVVVQPSCSIIGTLPKDVNVHRMDDLVAVVRSDNASPLQLLKLIASDSLREFAERLVHCHTPAEPPAPPLAAHKRIAPEPKQQVIPASLTAKCQGCTGPVSDAEIDFCQTRKSRFAGQILCRRCQSVAPEKLKSIETDHAPAIDLKAEVARCVGCGSGVDRKVVAFCRFSSKRFAGRILCRTCQAGVP